MPLSKVVQDIVNILSDKQWHPIHEFYRLGDDITPEKASSVYMRRKSRRKSSNTIKPLSEIILRGRKIYVDGAIYDMRRHDRVLTRGDADNTEIMLNDAWYQAYLQRCGIERPAKRTKHPKLPEITIDGLTVKLDPKSGMLTIALPINELKIAIEQLG